MSGIKSGKIISTGLTLIALTACSTQPVKQEPSALSPSENAPTAPEPDNSAALVGPNPPLTLMKNGKILNLVRVMDGGACKNDVQGVKGTFLLYANPADIERIKREKGSHIFSDFENNIQDLATEALQQAINTSNLAEDPFALDDDEAQEKLARQLANNFRTEVVEAIDAFEKETTLSIDITAFPPSFVFYQRGCAVTEINTENPDEEAPSP